MRFMLGSKKKRGENAKRTNPRAVSKNYCACNAMRAAKGAWHIITPTPAHSHRYTHRHTQTELVWGKWVGK